MAFTPKDWKNSPDNTTPINETALEDMEVRLSGYTDSELATHVADTTNIHGIADTSALVTTTILTAHSDDTTGVHGIDDTADLVLTDDSRLTNARTPTGAAGGVLSGTYPNPGFAVDMATQAELNAHEADTTSIHGIADTSALATSTTVSNAVTNHNAATNVHGIADTTVLATDAEVTSAISVHSADTTSVHGIADTSQLVLTNDSRLVAPEQLATFFFTGTLTVQNGNVRFPFPWAATILGVYAQVGTAPTGSSIIIDVKKNATTIFTGGISRPTIASGSSASTGGSPSVTSIASGDFLTCDIVQVGSTTPGSNLTVQVRWRKA